MRIILVYFICTIAITSCRKSNDIPPSVVSDLKVFPGRNRALIEFIPPGGAVSGKVFFGNGQFREFNISEMTEQIMIDSLPEGQATFRVVTFNESGLVSDPKAVKTMVYGSNYESTLKARKWQNQINHSQNEIDLVFDTALESETGVTVVFINTSGMRDSVQIDSNQNIAVIKSIDLTKDYFYYSVYKPEASSVDEFLSPSIDGKEVLMMDFGKMGWQILSYSDERSVGEASAIIDNNLSTSWYSKPDINPGSKHWISVDMGAIKYVSGFYFANSQTNDKSAQSIIIDISNDGTNWIKVLEAPLENTFFRQKLELPETVLSRYFKITLTSSTDMNVTGTQFSEIDAYNANFTSSETGKDNWENSIAIPMVNAVGPFVGDGSNPFPLLGDKRLQRLQGWTHSESAKVSFDSDGNKFSLFSADVWGLPNVYDGRVFQTINLESGIYQLQIDVGGASGPAGLYGVIANGSQLPAFDSVTSVSSVFRYSKLMDNQNKKVNLHFVVSTTSNVAIGVVYNTHDQFSVNGTPWTTFEIKSWNLTKVD